MGRRTTREGRLPKILQVRTQDFAVLVVAAVIAISVPQSAAKGELANCEAGLRDVPSSNSGGLVFKLLLDELLLAGVPGSIVPEALAQSLRLKLLDNVSKIGLELDSVHVVVCLGRRPVNPTDIEPSALRFAKKNVILEVWGHYDGDEVVFTNAVIPLLASANATWASAHPFYYDSFAYDGSQEHLRFLKQIVKDSVHLRAYTAVGIATRSLMLEDFDRARYFFCRADWLLVVDRGDVGDPERGRLTSFVKNMSVAVIELAIQARQEGRYAGRLGKAQVPRGTPCES